MLIWLLVIHALALASAVMAALPWSIKAAVCGCVVAAGGVAWRRWVADVAGRRVVLLSAAEAGQVEVVRADGEILQGSVQPESAVLGPVTVVALRGASGERCEVVVLPDATSPADHRRLRTWLRWAGVPRSAVGPRN